MRRPMRAAALAGTFVLMACQAGTTSPPQSAAASPPSSAPSSVPSSAAASAAASSGPATLPPESSLTMWGYPNALLNFAQTNGTAELEAAVKSDLNIDLTLTTVAQNDLGAKLKAALPAGTGPDLVLTDFDVMNPYWQFMQPLDTYAAADWGATWQTNFTDSALTEMQLVGTIAGGAGKSYYLPGDMQLVGSVMYSKSLLAKAGVDPTTLTSFSDFLGACGKIKAAGLTADETAGHPATLVDDYMTFTENEAPGEMLLAERGKAKFTDPNMVKAFDDIAQIYNQCAEKGAIGTDTTQVFPAFFKIPQTAAMSTLFGGSGWFSFAAAPDPATKQLMNSDISTFAFPGSKGLVSTDAGVAMTASSTNKDAAWRLIKWFTTGAGAMHTAQTQNVPMAWKAIQPTPLGTAFDQNVAAPVYAQLANGDANKFRRVLCADVYNALTTVIPGVVTGQLTSAAAAQQVQTAFDTNCQKWVQQ